MRLKNNFTNSTDPNEWYLNFLPEFVKQSDRSESEVQAWLDSGIRARIAINHLQAEIKEDIKMPIADSLPPSRRGITLGIEESRADGQPAALESNREGGINTGIRQGCQRDGISLNIKDYRDNDTRD